MLHCTFQKAWEIEKKKIKTIWNIEKLEKSNTAESYLKHSEWSERMKNCT